MLLYVLRTLLTSCLFAVDSVMITSLKHFRYDTQLMEIPFHVDMSELVSAAPSRLHYL